MRTYVVCAGRTKVGYHKCKEAAAVTAASWMRDGYDVAIVVEEDSNVR